MENRLICLLLLPFSLYALPDEGEVVCGKATFTQADAHKLVIHAADKTVIHYSQFNIAENETVQFVQPKTSSAVLNKVTGNAPSQIFGHLNSNGKVFLINENGIVFGPNSQINTGSLIASTLDIKDQDFAIGNYAFQLGEKGKSSQIINQGNLSSSPEGQIVLMAPHIINEGAISARAGKVALLGGESVILDFTGDGLISFVVEGELQSSVIEHLGKISAAEGDVYLHLKTAKNLLKSVVNTDELVVGHALTTENGVVRLVNASQLEAKHVAIAAHDIAVEGDVRSSSQGKGGLSLSAPEGRVTLDSSIGAKRRFATVDVKALEIDQNSSVKASNALTYTGTTHLRGRISTVGGDVTFNGPVIRDGVDSVLIYTGSGSGNVTFNGPLDAEPQGKPAHSLTISAELGSISFNGPVGMTAPLQLLTVSSAETVSFQDVGNLGALSVTSEEAIRFNGHSYRASDQMWAAKSFHLIAPGTTYFMTDAMPLEFNIGTIQLAKGAHLDVNTHGGRLKLVSLNAPNFESVTLTTGTGKAYIGGMTGQVGHLTVTGHEIGLMHEIQAATVRMEATTNIYSEFEKTPLLSTGDMYLNAQKGTIGQMDKALAVEAGGFIHAGAKGSIHLVGTCADDVIHTLPSNPPTVVIFNEVEYYDPDAFSFFTRQDERVMSLAPDLFTHIPQQYVNPHDTKPRKVRLYYLSGS